MAKAIVVVGSTQMEGPSASLSYTATILGPPNYSYASNYLVNTSITVNANLLAWRNKIIAQAAEQSVILAASDVIVFGAPT